MSNPFDLIIWDCDGCLVDSEVLSCGVSAAYFTELGYPITTREFIDRFAGRSGDDDLAEIEKETGRTFTDRFSFLQVRQRTLEAFKADLQPISGVAAALEAMGLPGCIASGSSVPRILMSLKTTGLDSFFDKQAVFSTAKEDLAPTDQLLSGKPAPDIFLFAARQMGVVPSSCLVIEDSVHGVTGAKAAGMTAFGFTGGSHVTPAWEEKLRASPVDLIFDDMRALPGLVAAWQKGAQG